jgi:hypothetical protein
MRVVGKAVRIARDSVTVIGAEPHGQPLQGWSELERHGEKEDLRPVPLPELQGSTQANPNHHRASRTEVIPDQ